MFLFLHIMRRGRVVFIGYICFIGIVFDSSEIMFFVGADCALEGFGLGVV
jgi:hypothetical protein